MDRKSYVTGSGAVVYWVDATAGTDAAASSNAVASSNAAANPSAPWLVFLPGLTADHTLFDNQMSHFSGKANCFVWDAPAHGESRPYPLDFTMNDYARILHNILEVEGIKNPVLVGQSLGGYVSQAYMNLYPGEVAGFVSVDSAPLKRKFYPTWEVKFLRHTKGMYASMPWGLLKSWGTWGVATSDVGRANMLSFMESYTKSEYVNLAAYGYKMLAEAIEAEEPYEIDCPALLLCGEKDRAGDVKVFNRKWTAEEGIPLVWIPGAGHNSPVDAPEFVNAQIEEFLASLNL